MDDLFADSEPVPREPLASKIISLFRESTFDARPQDFLPEDCIRKLVTPNAIIEELELDSIRRKFTKLDSAWQETFINWIIEKAPRTFLITVQCDLAPSEHTVKALVGFQRCNFGDDQLPIDNPRRVNTGLSAHMNVQDHFDSKLWANFKVYKFYENQWKCLAPVFAPGKYNYDLSSECILPFRKGEGPPRVGAFSSVYLVTIDPAHNEHKGLDEVAIKEIKLSRGDQETDSAWELEARALASINELDHNHVVKCIAAIRRGDSRYFMFPWANGNSLRDFWEANATGTPKGYVIEQTIIQLRGLADALDKLHHFRGSSHGQSEFGNSSETSEANTPIVNIQNELWDDAGVPNIRHGDLKPENILRFTDGRPGSGIGTLKIADMGLAKQHIAATQDRYRVTSTRYGTVRYEAPETITAVDGARSRLYDIWSMGCITLEFIIWIIYGNNALETFDKDMRGATQQSCQFFEVLENMVPKQAKVHNVVLRWMDHIQYNDPECSRDSAIGDLLKIVRTKLLVVPLSPTRETRLSGGRLLPFPTSGSTSGIFRATASEFRDALDEIISKSARPAYLLTGLPRGGVNVPTIRSLPEHLSPGVARRPDGNTGLRTNLLGVQMSGVLGANTRADYTLPPLKDWTFPVDNAFAIKVLAKVGRNLFTPQNDRVAVLCGRCKGLDFWAGGFAFEDTISALEERAKICDFCRSLGNVCAKRTIPKGRKVRFERHQSTLIIAGGDPLPIFSISRSPECNTPLPIQLGLPKLLEPGTQRFFDIIRLWLEDCDEDKTHHKDCHGLPPTRLPTRLIDVGTSDAPCLRLLETQHDKVENNKYVALSHPWGDPENHPPFSTLRTDDSGRGRTLENFKKSIPYDELPPTFKDAVNTTRALGVRYCYIDSICIIQGREGDFNEEAKRMEDVFSGAYCVIAASRATGQWDGFLGSRPHREYITMQRGAERPFYICEPIDDFSAHVLEGGLNTRGWVLQERALARRTIYFTERQTYFECGNGVRCETLGRMQNNMADFLGDPKFPDKAMRATSRALKISYFQSLYEQYSRLGFSKVEDRPIAIAGLEKRLQKAFGTKGGYAIFDDGPDGGLFHRSLLWQRGSDESTLRPINFPPERNIKVPSWSWMAYEGGIDYGDPPFQTADWEENEIRPPWSSAGVAHSSVPQEEEGIALTATVRDFAVAGRKADDARLIYDTDRATSTHCVVVARSREGKRSQERKHYVLIVASTNRATALGETIYKRIGAGYMLGKYIALEKPGIAAKIY